MIFQLKILWQYFNSSTDVLTLNFCKFLIGKILCFYFSEIMLKFEA